MDLLADLKNKIIVSVQAMPAEPFYLEACMNAMMRSVVSGGAQCLRLAGARDVKNAKSKFSLPVIGLTKPDVLPDNWKEVIYITPTVADAQALIEAGADIIAFDATQRPRTKNTLKEIIDCIKSSGKIAMADIATVKEGIKARKLGADVISTTLSGYTQQSPPVNEDKPDYDLLERLVRVVDCPVILEGRVWEPAHVKEAFRIGAHSVVIGSAITRPQLITKRFLNWNHDEKSFSV